jgi:hypothetical protein
MSIDLGNGYEMRYTEWRPDRELNPQYNEKKFPDVEKFSIILTCPHGETGVVTLDGPVQRKLYGTDNENRPLWKVVSEDPLTLEPSIQTPCCHGYIRDGEWVSA